MRLHKSAYSCFETIVNLMNYINNIQNENLILSLELVFNWPIYSSWISHEIENKLDRMHSKKIIGFIHNQYEYFSVEITDSIAEI